MDERRQDAQGDQDFTSLVASKGPMCEKHPKSIFENLDDGNRLIDVSELGLRLGVAPKTIYGWHYKGLIKAYKVGPRLIRFDYEEVRKWLAKT